MTSLRCTRHRRRGFTLIEVLAAMLLWMIVLPAIMRAMTTASSASLIARQRTEAAGLAEEKLNEIIATGEWQTAQLTGDFGSDAPGYRWTCVSQAWTQPITSPSSLSSSSSSSANAIGLTEVDVKVTWTNRGSQQSLTVSTLTYVRGTTQ